MSRKRISSIYAIKNIATGKMYIGKSVHTNNRWRNHLADLRNNKHHSEHLQNSFNKYGEKVFVFGIIEECSTDLLNERERYWIDYYDSYNKGYNCAIPNGKNQGKEITEEEKAKISKAMKKYHSTQPKYKRKAHMDYIRSLVDYSKERNFARKYTLYNPNTLEVQHVFNNRRECATFFKYY